MEAPMTRGSVDGVVLTVNAASAEVAMTVVRRNAGNAAQMTVFIGTSCRHSDGGYCRIGGARDQPSRRFNLDSSHVNPSIRALTSSGDDAGHGDGDRDRH